MNFEYCFQPRSTADIELEDPYNCCIKAMDMKQQEYYLYIKTVLGETQIVQYGPYMEGLVPPAIYYSYSRIPFSERRVCSVIDKFLNSNDIFQAEEVELEEIKDRFQNLIEKVQ